MAVTTWTAGQVLAAQDLNDTFGSKLDSSAYQPGMVLITEETFTAVSNVSVNGCFTSTYRSYKIVADVFGSDSTGFNMRLRASGTDNSTASSYVCERLIGAAGSASSASSTDNIWLGIGIHNTSFGLSVFHITQPAIAAQTAIVVTSGRSSAIAISGGVHTQTVAYDGFSWIAASGTITGRLRIYGLRD